MSVNIPTHYVQQYSTNLNLLLQQKGSKLRGLVSTGSHVGKAASPVDQIGKIEMQTVTGRFNPMSRVDAPTDRRWVYPSDYDLPQLLDSFDELRLITDPKAKYSENAALAAGRKMDTVILTAALGTAKTGETGGTSTVFATGNEVDKDVGGANSKLNVAKLRECRRLMMANYVDLDMEMPIIPITAADHDALLGEIQVVSRDFNGGAPVLQNGRINEFMGFRFVPCELVETVCAGTNEVTIPVWVPSGMYLGMWNDFTANVSQRNDLQGEPWQLYTKMTVGATRLEENRVYAIESYRS
jgi:hypothetical protein